MRDRREQQDVKIAKGIVSKLEMMKEFRSNLEMLEGIFQIIDVRLSLLYNHLY